MNKTKLIYNKLYKSFGKQGWWPLTIKGNKSKHHIGKPKTNKHRFEIIIGSILTQNTNWKNVEKALYNLSKNGLIDIVHIMAHKVQVQFCQLLLLQHLLLRGLTVRDIENYTP